MSKAESFTTLTPAGVLQKIKAEKDVAEKIRLQIFFLHKYPATDRSIAYPMAMRIIKTARQHNMLAEYAAGCQLVAMYLLGDGDFKSALKYIDAGERAAVEANAEVTLASLYRNRYILNIMQGKVPESIDSITRCIAIAEQLNNEMILMTAYINIAELIANHVQDYPRSIAYLEKSLAITTKNNKPFTRSGALIAMGEIYNLTGEFAKAKKVLDEAYRIVRKHQLKVPETRALCAMGGYYKATKKYKQALEQFHKVEALIKEIGEGSLEQIVYYQLAHIYFKINNVAAARKYIRKYLKFDSGNQSAYESVNLKILQSEILAKDGQYKKAWQFMLQAHEIADSLYKDDTKRKIDIVARAHQAEILAKEKAIAEDHARQRMDFLANMSHEIRSPMNAVLGIGNILLKRNVANDNTGYIRTIISSSEALLEVVNDILDISKIDAGKLSIVYEDASVVDVLNGVKSILEHKAAEKGISFDCHIAEEVAGSYSFDAHRLRQVLINLAGNAIKFTATGSVQIAVSLLNKKRNAHTLQFKVSDTGIGMSQQQLTKIFERYEQADKLTTRRYGGTGLGLSISKKIVELMGGKISAQSQAGKGSVFVVELKLTPVYNSPANTGGDIDLYAGALNGKRFLIADDNAVNLSVLGQTLSDLLPQSVVISVNNGEEVLAELKTQTFDFLITDLHMPVMNGITAVNHIKKDGKHPQMKIIALTATIALADTTQTQKMGFDAWMNKPYKEAELFKTLYTLL
ncbi:MAG TPA: ATP-binding protein [Chitinophagales bacterium]|nr:ATP-binding protein [Chitinophagales bacterium]